MAVDLKSEDTAETIVAWIDHLDRSSLRLLRNAVGSGISDHAQASELFSQFHRDYTPKEDEEAVFCAITLCAVSKAGKETHGSFAARLGSADPDCQFSDFLAHILDITALQSLSAQIAHGIRYLNSQRKFLDRVHLVRDILAWSQEERPVQRSWAKEYSRQAGMTAPLVDDPVRGFLGRIQPLQEEKKQAIRSTPGESLYRSTGMGLIAFYAALPEIVPPEDEPLYYLVAALSLLNEEPALPCKNLGASLQSVCAQENEEYLSGIMTELIQGEIHEIFPLLAKAVIYMRNLRVGLCAEKLLNDLLFWNHPARSVQNTWEKSFFG